MLAENECLAEYECTCRIPLFEYPCRDRRVLAELGGRVQGAQGADLLASVALLIQLLDVGLTPDPDNNPPGQSSRGP